MINLNDKLQQREIRIFISSTFRDMMAERDHLLKQVFPKLRKLCQTRGVELTEVDLRWGVTEEQAQEGKVIEICLQEIDRCRPYFIGLLGERYGWVPDPQEIEKQQRIVQDFPWVKADIDEQLSITEMEIQYGVLRNPEQVARAFFYLRDPANTPTEFKEADGSVAQQKLITLKAAIRQQQTHPHHDYADLATLEAQIISDFSGFLDATFPSEEAPSELERARLDHAAFALSRLKVYIGGQDYIAQLDAHINSDAPPLVVTGESGLGKSALLANWIAHYQKQQPDIFVLYHFIGGAPDSSDHVTLMRRIMLEMQAQFGITDEVPSDPQQIAEAFPQYLTKTPHSKKWVLVLDALNQLEDKDNARWLGWLPAFIPDNIRVIVSTLPGESLETLQQRPHVDMTINPMGLDERRTLITNYLKFYTKELKLAFVDKIAQDPKSASPLILRTILDELRIFGDHEALQQRIDYYLAPQTPADFFDAVLTRLEQDYESQHPGLVGEILSLIWVARRGLSESEILAITNIPPLYWTPLYNAIENHLVSRAGLLDFFHDYLRQAIKERYLYSEDKKKACYLKLANYFSKDHLSDRAIDELPYQLLQAEEWERLKANIADLGVFEQLKTDKRKYELLGYWNAIGDRYDMAIAYQQALVQLENHYSVENQLAYQINEVAVFLQDAANYQNAEPLYRRVLAIHEKVLSPEHPDTALVINNLASLLEHKGDYAQAESLYHRALAIREKVQGPEHLETALVLSNLASLLDHKGDYVQAESLYHRALTIREKILGPEHLKTAQILSNLADLLDNKGDYAQAELLYRRALAIREKVLGPEHPDTALSLNNLANLLEHKGNYEQAEVLNRRALTIFEKVKGPDHPDTASSLNNLAGLLSNKGNYDQAESLYRHVLAISEKVYGPEHPIYAVSLNNLACLLQKIGDFAGAEPLYRRALAISENALGSEHPGTASNLDNLAGLLKVQGDYVNAELLFRHAVDIREKSLGLEHPDTAISLNNLAGLLKDQGDYENAELLYRRVYKILNKSLGQEHPHTILSINNLALLLDNKGDYDQAELLYRRVLAVREKALGPDHSDTAISLNTLALLLDDKGSYQQAEPLYRRALSIRLKTLGNEHPDTIISQYNLATLLGKKGEYDAAEIQFKQLLEITEKLYGPEYTDVANALRGMAIVLYFKSETSRALPLIQRALAIYKKTLGSDHPDTIATGNDMAKILLRMGN